MLTQNLSDGINYTVCSSCNGKLVSDFYNGEKICSMCGIVATDGQEVSVINETDFASTAPSSMTNNGELTSIMMYDIGLPSVINNKNVDVNGKHIHHLEIEKLRRLNNLTISSNPKTKNLNKAVREIRRITEIMGFNTLIAERACYIYRKILNKGAIRGRSIIGIASATIWVACEEMHTPFSIDKIVELAGNSTKKGISRYYKFILRQLQMNVRIIGPSYNVSQIAKKSGLSVKTERKALEILEQVRNDPILSGKKPISLAAAALYLASFQTKEHATQLRIAIASELTTITIRKRSMELSQILSQAKSISNKVNETRPSTKLAGPTQTDSELKPVLTVKK